MRYIGRELTRYSEESYRSYEKKTVPNRDRARLERISEAHVQVDGIHREGNRVEIFPEDIVQSPRQVGVHDQVLEGLPLRADLRAPLELPQLVREVVRRPVVARELHLRARRVVFPQVAFVHVSGEFPARDEREVRSRREAHPVVQAVQGHDRYREVRVLHLCLHAAGPVAPQLLAAVADNLHAVVLHRGVRLHALVLQTEAEHHAPRLPLAEPFLHVALQGDAERGAVLVDGPDLAGQGHRRRAPDVHPGFHGVLQSPEGRPDDTPVLFLLRPRGERAEQ